MLQTKAVYNLLRLNAAEDPSIKGDSWALEDLRRLSLEELQGRLNLYKVNLDRRSFLQFADEVDTPEELADLLLPDEASEKLRDPFYLIIFELWRRLLPQKQSLSIFCDELDHRIDLYDQGEMESDELIQDALANLLEVLDENADIGVEPQEILLAISDYCAHDLEGFLYDYISDLLDADNVLYAKELIEAFSPYITDTLWFDLARTRVGALTDVAQANLELSQLLKHDLELDLLLEILRFLPTIKDQGLFNLAVQKTIPLLALQEDFIDVLRLIADFYRRLDQEEKQKTVEKILEASNGAPVPLTADDLHELIK